MYTWFECRIRYEKIVDGKMKKVTEPYLIEAYSYTEAEARIIKELTPLFNECIEKGISIQEISPELNKEWNEIILAISKHK